MKNPTRKSTALVSLVLVPMNLLGLGFTAGCDSRDDNAQTSAGSFSESQPPPTNIDGDLVEVIDFDAADPNDPFTLDPVTGPQPVPPTTQPTTQPLAKSNFASQTPYRSGTYTHSRAGGGFFFVPIPFRSGYRPMYRPGFVSPHYGAGGFRPGYAPGRPGYTPPRPGTPGYSQSTPSRSGSPSHSSGVSRGGFGSSGHASSSSGS